MVRHQVKELQMMGPFPSEQAMIRADPHRLVEKYELLLRSIEAPVTDEEAAILTGIFRNEDSLFGLAWTLLHLIETAPNWPLEKCLVNATNEWIQRLKDRDERWRAAGYPARRFYAEAGLPDPRQNRG